MDKPRYYRGTALGAWRIVYLCILAVFSPKRFGKENEKDMEILAPSFEGAQPEPSANVVFRAFWFSLLLVLLSTGAGYLLAQACLETYGCASSQFTTVLAGIGAAILLWGTLFVRGWQIQTFKGVSLVERVNQWLYRCLYCVGTAVVVCSVSWPGCK